MQYYYIISNTYVPVPLNGRYAEDITNENQKSYKAYHMVSTPIPDSRLGRDVTPLVQLFWWTNLVRATLGVQTVAPRMPSSHSSSLLPAGSSGLPLVTHLTSADNSSTGISASLPTPTPAPAPGIPHSRSVTPLSDADVPTPTCMKSIYCCRLWAFGAGLTTVCSCVLYLVYSTVTANFRCLLKMYVNVE